jgi:hypothetical protein
MVMSQWGGFCPWGSVLIARSSSGFVEDQWVKCECLLDSLLGMCLRWSGTRGTAGTARAAIVPRSE